MTKYSVIIPVYNVEKYLWRCVRSVLDKETKSEYEIILVDDGSTDPSGMICDALAKEDNRVKVIHQENGGASRARNTGLDAATGEYIIFLDSDDFWIGNLFACLDGLLDENIDIVQFGYWRVNENGEKIGPGETVIMPCVSSGKAFLDVVFAEGKSPLPFPWCYSFRRELLNVNNIRFKEDILISEDFLFDMQAIPLAEKIVVTEEKIVGYVEREGSLTANLSVKKLHDNLSCKIKVFRSFPVAPIANDFMFQALRTADFKGEEYKSLVKLIKNNIDIAEYTSSSTLRIVGLFIKIFGVGLGIKLFALLAKLKKR